MIKPFITLLLAALMLPAMICTAAAGGLPEGETTAIGAGLLIAKKPADWLADEDARAWFALLAQSALNKAWPEEQVRQEQDTSLGFLVGLRDDTAVCAWQSKAGDLYLVYYGSDGAKAARQRGVSLADYRQSASLQGCTIYEVTGDSTHSAIQSMNMLLMPLASADPYEEPIRVELAADDPMRRLPGCFPVYAVSDRQALADQALAAAFASCSLCRDIGAAWVMLDELCLIGSPEACTVLFRIGYEEDDLEDVVSIRISDALYVMKYGDTRVADIKGSFADEGEVIDFTDKEIRAAHQAYLDAAGK